MKKRTNIKSRRTWTRIGVWVGAAGLLVLSIGWLFPALAATPAWWDCDYGYRQQLTVSATSAVPVNYSTTLTFDHAALVTAGKSQADGDDIRIVYWNGSDWVPLDRWLDPDSTWNNSATKVWFKVQAAISSSSSDTNYYLYYSNTLAVNPPDIPQNIFVFYDGFESADLSAWDASSAPDPGDIIEASTAQVRTGSYGLKAVIDNTPPAPDPADGKPSAKVWKNPTAETSYLARIHIYLDPTFSLPGDPDWGHLTVMELIHDTGTWTNIISATIKNDRTLYIWNDIAGEAYGFQATNTISTGSWHTLEIQATISPTAGEARLWLDGTQEITATGKNLGSGDTNRFSTGIYWGDPYDQPNTVYIDNAILRLYVNPEPTTSLGAEEANDCPPGDPPLCTWPYRRQLTFDNTFAGNETLTDFPVLVVLNSSRIDYSKTQDAGQDLRFYDADGVTKLSHEIEQWNESGNSYVWVKVKQITAGSSTDHILMYYGQPTAPDGQDPEAVWSNGFEAVWHLHNDFQDSTSNNHDATNGGSTDITDGVAADGQDLDGNDWIDTNFISNYAASQNFTWEGWFNVGNINGSDGIFGIEDRGGSDLSEIRLSIRENLTGSNPVNMYNTWIRPDSGTSYNGDTAISPSSGNWHYAVLLRGGSTGRLYLDGSEVNNNTASTNALTFPKTLLIGAQWDTDTGGSAKRNWFDGKLDEIRTSTTNRSAGWIKATYNTIKDTFITYESQESVGTSVGYFTPDAAAAGMSVPVTFVGNICAVPAVTTTNSDIVVGPSILTDSSGNVVTQNGSAVSTMFFLKPDARPATGITVSLDGVPLSQTFDIVIPAPDPNITSGTGTLSGRTKRGTAVLGGLTVASGATLKISTSDTDGATAGNQGYLPPTILVKGDVDISGTLDLSGQDGTDAAADCVGGDGGAGAPGGGGGGGGGVTDPGCGGGGGTTDLGPLHDTYVKTNDETANGAEIHLKVKKAAPGSSSYRQSFIKFDTTSITDTITSATLKLSVEVVSAWPDPSTLQIYEYTDNNWDESTVWSNRPPDSEIGAVLGTLPSPPSPDPSLLTIDVTAYVLARRAGGNDVISFTARMATSVNGGVYIDPREGTVPPVLTIEAGSGGGGAPAAVGGSGYSGGGGGGAKGSGSGASGGDGTNAAGAAGSVPNGGAGGTALAGATGGAGGMPSNETTGGDGGSGGTGDPVGTGGGAGGPFDDGAPAGAGGGGGGASGGSPGGGGGGGFATAGGRGPDLPDAGFGGNISGNGQLVPLAGGSGGAGGGPNKTTSTIGGGGGGAGGAILIYATGSVSATGTMTADGGDGGAGYNAGAEGSGGGGAGSGGAFLIQSADVTASGTLTTAGGTAGTGGEGNAGGGAGGDGRIRIDGLAAGASVPGTAGSKFIGPVINNLVGTTVTGRADGGSSVTLYVYDKTGAQVTGSPYSASASGATGSVGTWTISGVTFPSGVGYLAVKQSSGGTEVFGPGRSTRGIHLINWREVY